MVNKLQTITFTALWDVKRTFFKISDIENEFENYSNKKYFSYRCQTDIYSLVSDIGNAINVHLTPRGVERLLIQ